jgi:hypothetical protein
MIATYVCLVKVSFFNDQESSAPSQQGQFQHPENRMEEESNTLGRRFVLGITC